MTDIDPMGQMHKETDCLSIYKITNPLTVGCATLKIEGWSIQGQVASLFKALEDSASPVF